MLAYPSLLSRSYRDAILSTLGLAGYWRFGDPTGTVAKDECGRNNGTYTGSPTLGTVGFLSGDPNRAVTLSGTGQYVSLTGIDLEASDWTILANLRPSTVTGDHYFIGAATGGVSAHITGTALQAVNRAVGAAPSATGFTAAIGTSYLIGMTFALTGTDLRYYSNGAFLSAHTWATTFTAGAKTTAIGSAGGNVAVFAGTVGDQAWFNRVLTAAEIANIYRIGRGF